MDFGKVMGKFFKHFLVTIVAVLASALALSQGYQGDNALNSVIFTYVVAPIIAGMIGALQNWIKHLND